MKLSEKAYNFAQKILKLNENSKEKIERKDSKEIKTLEKKYSIDETRVIGKTDYKKYEEMAKNIDLEEITTEKNTKEALKMGCNNDLRKQRQLFEKPSVEKLEAAKIFKNEGDDFLKNKQFTEAVNSYEKGLLQLFYTFADDPEEDKKVDELKKSINMNLSLCKINLQKYDEAIGYCQEALRIDKNNLKAIYRQAFSYFKLDKFDDAKTLIEQGLTLQEDSQEFLSLKNDIAKKEKEEEDNSRKLFKKLIK
jgi:tetratricopeptide (TPR) repeat protein